LPERMALKLVDFEPIENPRVVVFMLVFDPLVSVVGYGGKHRHHS
jgi:hypothetical protein